MSVDGVHLEASLPSPASCGAVSLQIPLPWNLWFHTSLGPCCSPGIPADTSISLLPLGMVYRMGFTQYLAASSGLVTTTQGWYPYLAPVLAPPRQVSLYTISGVCCYGSTGPLHTSTGTSPGTPYLAYPGIRGGYPQDAISGHLGGGMSGYPSQDTPYEVIPLVGGSMDTMPRYLSGGIL
jgi:hypothetical protein